MQLKLSRRRKMYAYYMKEMIFVTTCKEAIWKSIIYFSIFFIAMVLSFVPQLLLSKDKPSHQHPRFQTDLKYILIWNHPRHIKRVNYKIYAPGQSLFINQKCKFINCYITYNKSLLYDDEDFDAIVFDIRNLKKFPKKLNLTRSPHQKYIFKSLEPSERFPLCNPNFDNFFNWTWAYKLNSDIAHPFIHIHDINKKVIGPKENVEWIVKMDHNDIYKNNVKSKTKAVVWFISQCKIKPKHNEFVVALNNELKGYNYTVDVFGPCDKLKCADNNFHKCARDYFFELVLEEAIAEDYVGDKIVNTLQHVTVPIVLGGANYTRFLPPGSYIDVKTFDIKKLGALIDYLIKNPKMYEYFLDWKNHYYYTVNPVNNVCDLCEKLNRNTTVTTYPNFRLWWNSDYRDNCERMKLYHMFNE